MTSGFVLEEGLVGRSGCVAFWMVMCLMRSSRWHDTSSANWPHSSTVTPVRSFQQEVWAAANWQGEKEISLVH